MLIIVIDILGFTCHNINVVYYYINKIPICVSVKGEKVMKKNKKNEKGFTLVEIIVVLVILAILAAAAIPTMLGFVEDAKGKTEVANARAAYVASQTIATEKYATGSTDSEIPGLVTLDKVKELTGIDDAKAVTVNTVVKGKVSKITYKGATHTVVIEVGKDATVEKNKD